MRRIYGWLLRLYPREIREVFAEEMAVVFEWAADEQRARGCRAYLRFLLAEFFGLLAGLASTRILRRPPAALDLRNMRPPEVSRETYTSAVDEVLDAQRRAARTLQQMQEAIARHDFLNARYYSEQDHQARAHLRLIQRKYRIAN